MNCVNLVGFARFLTKSAPISLYITLGIAKGLAMAAPGIHERKTRDSTKKRSQALFFVASAREQCDGFCCGRRVFGCALWALGFDVVF